MFTKIVGRKRVCLPLLMEYYKSWDYIKQTLVECGFDLIKEANPKEYLMKGCKGKIIVYVKYPEKNKSVIVFINDEEESDQISIDWGPSTNDYEVMGEQILTKIRGLLG